VGKTNDEEKIIFKERHVNKVLIGLPRTCWHPDVKKKMEET
jgi:hypothetical protein